MTRNLFPAKRNDCQAQSRHIYKENVIGTVAEHNYADGRIVRAELALGRLDIRPGKPEHIFAQTGLLPVFAGGNADVDIEMLSAAKFALLVDHDDEGSSPTPAAPRSRWLRPKSWAGPWSA